MEAEKLIEKLKKIEERQNEIKRKYSPGECLSVDDEKEYRKLQEQQTKLVGVATGDVVHISDMVKLIRKIIKLELNA